METFRGKATTKKEFMKYIKYFEDPYLVIVSDSWYELANDYFYIKDKSNYSSSIELSGCKLTKDKLTNE